MRLGVLHALGALGVPLVNDARAIERCTDKSMASFLLVARGLARRRRPSSRRSLAQARAIARRECARGPLVLKPLFGAQGWGLRLIRNESGAAVACRRRAASIICSASSPPRGAARFEDMRILVSRGRDHRRDAAALGAMDHQCAAGRESPSRSTPTPVEAEIALRAAEALGADLSPASI